MDDEAAVDLKARLFAIEYLLTNLWVGHYRETRQQPDRILAAHARAKEALATSTAPGAGGPAMSDHMSASIAENVDRLLTAVEEMAGVRQGTAQDNGTLWKL
jgi:hypothetical protein